MNKITYEQTINPPDYSSQVTKSPIRVYIIAQSIEP